MLVSMLIFMDAGDLLLQRAKTVSHSLILEGCVSPRKLQWRGFRSEEWNYAEDILNGKSWRKSR